MRPTDIVFNQLGLPDEDHAKECDHCAKFRDAIIRAREEVERIQDASPVSKLTAEELCAKFSVEIVVDPADMNHIAVMIHGIPTKAEGFIEVPDEGREYTLEKRIKAVTDAFLNLWSTLYTTNAANQRISDMYDEFDSIREGEHAPTSSHLN